MGETHSVREFLDVAVSRCGLDWKGHVEIDSRYLRPTEVDYLLGNAARARRDLGWKPDVGFEQLVHMMIDHELELTRQESLLIRATQGLNNA